MSSPPDRKEYTRAYRQGEKEERRQLIVESAEAVLREIDFDKFTFDRVVEKSGFSRGGIYKYFRSKEDLLLTIHMRQIEAWSGRFLKKIHPGISDEDFVKAYLDVSLADPLYLKLVRRFESIANENASDEAIARWQQFFREDTDRRFSRVAECLELDGRSAADAMYALSAMIVGVSLQRNPRSLARLDFPGTEDNRPRIAFKQRFLKYGLTVLKGLRRD